LPSSLLLLGIESSSQVWSIRVCSVLIFNWLQNCHFLWSWGSWWSLGFTFSLAVTLNLSERGLLLSGRGRAWTGRDDINSLSRFSWLEVVLWCSLSSVCWNLSNVFVNEMVDIRSNIF